MADTCSTARRRVEVLPDRVLLYTDDGDDAVAAVHRRGARRRRASRAPQHARRRVPPAHRPHPGRLMASTVDAASRASCESSRLLSRLPAHVAGRRRRRRSSTRCCSCSRMGVGLGSLVDKGATPCNRVARRRRLPRVPRARPAGRDGDAGRRGRESTWPVLGVGQVEPASTDAMLATPLGVGDLVAGQLTWIGLRVLQTTRRRSSS